MRFFEPEAGFPSFYLIIQAVCKRALSRQNIEFNLRFHFCLHAQNAVGRCINLYLFSVQLPSKLQKNSTNYVSRLQPNLGISKDFQPLLLKLSRDSIFKGRGLHPVPQPVPTPVCRSSDCSPRRGCQHVVRGLPPSTRRIRVLRVLRHRSVTSCHNYQVTRKIVDFSIFFYSKQRQNMRKQDIKMCEHYWVNQNKETENFSLCLSIILSLHIKSSTIPTFRKSL